MDALGDLAEECGCDLLVAGVFAEVDGDEDLLSLLVNVTNVYTTLVGEEDPVALVRDTVSGGAGLTAVA